MAPPAPTRNKNTKKPVSNDNKTPAPIFTPNRQLTRTPPPSENPPIAGTPLTTQPDKSSTAQPKEALAIQQNKAPTAQPDKALTTQPAEASTTQPDSEPTPSTSITVAPQNATPKTPLDKAMDALNAALVQVSEAYQKTMANLNQEEDRSHINIETPILHFRRYWEETHTSERISRTTKSKTNRTRRILQSS